MKSKILLALLCTLALSYTSHAQVWGNWNAITDPTSLDGLNSSCYQCGDVVGVYESNGLWAYIRANTYCMSGSPNCETGSTLVVNPSYSKYIFTPDGYYAAGIFTINTSTDTNIVAQWNGSDWVALGGNTDTFFRPFNNTYNTMIEGSGNTLYVTGAFKDTAGKYFVAYWNGQIWSELGMGTNALKANGVTNLLAKDALGNIYTAGHFTDASGRQYVAKWNGTTWSELGGASNNPLNMNEDIEALAIDRNNNVYIAGINGSSNSYVAKWDGTQWNQLGSPGKTSNGYASSLPAMTLAVDSKGSLYAAGSLWTDSVYTSNGNYYQAANIVMEWDGTKWNYMNSAVNTLLCFGGIKSMYVTSSDVLYIVAAGGINFPCLSNGGDGYDVAYYTPSTGVQELNGSSAGVHLYPNPAGSAFIIHSDNPVADRHLQVTDAIGREVYTANFTNKDMRVDVSQWNDGLYLYTVYGNNVKTSGRFVVAH